MTSFCPLAKDSCKVDFKPFYQFGVWQMCLMADCLNGSQPKLLRLDFGLLVRHENLAFCGLLTAFGVGFIDGLNSLRM